MVLVGGGQGKVWSLNLTPQCATIKSEQFSFSFLIPISRSYPLQKNQLEWKS